MSCNGRKLSLFHKFNILFTIKTVNILLTIKIVVCISPTKIKTEQERVKLNFISQNNELYNKDFNLDKLVEAIQLSHDSATGPDEIHYQMLKHLPENSL